MQRLELSKDMGYCGNCKYLGDRHTCTKYHKRLGYIKQTGSVSFTVHEQCSDCKKDEVIKKLQSKLNCNFVKHGCLEKNCSKCNHR